MMKSRFTTLLLIALLLAPQPITARKPDVQVLAQAPATSLHLSITDAVPTPREPGPALRTKFEPSLLKALLASAGKETLRGIVLMHEQPDVRQMDLAGMDRPTRAEAIIRQLQSTADRSQANVRAVLEKGRIERRVQAYRPLWIVNGIAVEGSREIFYELAAHPDVSVIRQDHVHYLPDADRADVRAVEPSVQPGSVQWNVQRIGADRVWAELGITGEDTVVANLDSGVDWEHPDLKTSYRGYTGKPFAEHDGNWYCATDEGYTYPGDGLGHGTHTMGTMVGQNGIGIAPGARWIAAKVFDNAGLAYDSWIHDGFQWLLAPDGDPTLAPDVVNSSWGSAVGMNQQFLPDVQALRAAGIVPVFSAGNYGPNVETIGSPASFGESLAVGATDVDDAIARFSSRGPSPWGEIKPEVSAPGVDILSTIPGGALGTKQGTSMAAPHVAGLVALMHQANSTLTVDEVEAILIATALPLGDGHPNNDYGWGLIDAYAATVHAGHVGRLAGLVTNSSDGTLIAGATVQAVRHSSTMTTTTTTDVYGSYNVGLGADHYDVAFSAFGYSPQLAYNVEITVGVTTMHDVTLAPLPTGVLQGTILKLNTNTPLEAVIRVPDAPPTATSEASSGAYSLTLPVGAHVVRVESTGHRFVTATVTIAHGVTTYHDFVLQPAPTILLVDSGAWYNHSQRAYYEQALQHLGYLYDRHIIANVDVAPTDVPTASTLLPYDVVIWSAPLDAPGYVGATAAITTYLSGGGRLLLSGQDIAFWDGGGSGFLWASYLQDYIKARYVQDSAPSRVLDGRGTLFAGMTITIAGVGGADNQYYPDVIAATEEDYASPAWMYRGSGSSGQTVGLCLPYRAVYFSFGFEAIDDHVTRRQVLERSIDWLVSPLQPAGIELNTGVLPQIERPGSWITHALRLRNTGEITTDTYSIDLAGGAWPTVLLNPASITLGACQSATLQISMTVPADIGWHVYETTTLAARSALSPSVASTATLVSKSPAPVLLVDGSRFFRLDGRYRDALSGAGIPYDYHRVKNMWPLGVPATDTLSMYPMVVWYTAYDWYRPLSDGEEARLITYLDGGGRLLFSSQDYLYYGRDNSLALDYLGVLDYIEDLETTRAWGEPLHPIGWGLGPYTLTYTYTNWSDGLIPVPDAQTVLRGQHQRPAAIAHSGDGWRTAFTAFSFETLDADASQTLIDRTVGWLSWLGSSTWQADRRTVASGSEVTMTGVLRNDGWDDIATAHLAATLPAELSLISGTLSPGATYHSPTRTVTWQGSIAQDSTFTISFRVRVADPLPDATQVSFPAQIGYDDHYMRFERPYILSVNAPDLSASALIVEPTSSPPLKVLTYTLTVRNSGMRDATATVAAAIPTATLPAFATFTGTLDSGGIGSGNLLSKTLAWTGSVAAGDVVTLRYRVALDSSDDYWLVHEAWVSDQYGERWPVEARTKVRYWKTYWPIICK